VPSGNSTRAFPLASAIGPARRPCEVSPGYVCPFRKRWSRRL
jgi:hypothetical protein